MKYKRKNPSALRFTTFILATFVILKAASSTAVDSATAQMDSETAESSGKPNIVLFLTDDQGWGDLSYTGNTSLKTPHIDSIGQQGVSFNRFYVNPVCSPTRAALLTGRHSLRTGVFSVTRGGEKMRSEEITLAEMLKQHNYVTGMFGKWHNGAQYPHDPLGQGFDEYLGLIDGHQTLYFEAELMRNGKPIKSKGYIADVTTDAAIDFIRRANGRPFFAYIPFNTPHSPFELPQHYFDKYKQKGLSDLDASVYGMMENVDDNVGRVLDTLDSLNIADNTIVLYMSDNGPAFPNGQSRFNGGLKGHKGQLDEGGVRSPLLIHWPSHITGGRRIKSIAQHLDITPSLMSIIKGEMPNGRVVDGDDISALLLNPKADATWPDRTLYLHHFRNTQREDDKAIMPNPGSVRTQNWLATFGHDEKWRLYNLRTDEQQQQEIGKQFPDVLKKLRQQYFEFYNDITSIPAQTLPIELGHSGHEQVVMAAHEAAIKGHGIDYAHKDGWAHDWIVISSDVREGEIKWPVKAVVSGKYRIELQYASPSGPAQVDLGLTLLDSQHQLTSELSQFTPHIDRGKRLYYTGEAPELTWTYATLGEFPLSANQGEIKITFKALKRPGESDDLLIKGIRLLKL